MAAPGGGLDTDIVGVAALDVGTLTATLLVRVDFSSSSESDEPM